MKEKIILCLGIFFLAFGIVAYSAPYGRLMRMKNQAAISGITLSRENDRMGVGMDVDLSKVNVAGNKSFFIIPIIKGEDRSVELRPIGLFSRGRLISDSRRNGTGGG